MGLILGLTFAALIVILLVAFLGGYYAIIRRPPVINVVIPGITVSIPFMPPIHVDLSKMIPSPLQVQVLAADHFKAAMISPNDEMIPAEILDYIDMESEAHARVLRRHHVRKLRAERGNWDAAFNALKAEDNRQ